MLRFRLPRMVISMRQHDAQEAFDLLLVHAANAVDETAAASLVARPLTAAEIHGSSPFWMICGAVCRTTEICAACEHTSEAKVEHLHSVAMAIPAETSTIEEIFLRHWGLEPLDDLCPRATCRAQSRRSKRTELIKWPQVLVVTLKRWRVLSMNPDRIQKDPTHVGFELAWSAEHDRPPYLLRSLIVHDGEAGGGHYTAYVRGQSNVWYFCDDWCSPRQVAVAEVLGAQAYLLFYER